jgi:hypothetical protein
MPLDKYEVTIRGKHHPNDRWTMMFDAEDFAHAQYKTVAELERQYKNGDWKQQEEIILIAKDWTSS